MAAPTTGTISVWVMHGNGRHKNKVAEYSVHEFQATYADGFDKNKAIRIPKKICALGSRGDYIAILYLSDTDSLDVSVCAAAATQARASLEVQDYTSVPLNVQLGYFGAFSPFKTPRPRISRGSLLGVDHEAKNLEVYGSGDSRVTESTTDTTVDSYSEIWRFTPNLDGVALIRAGAIINFDLSTFTVV